jgi:hypothetical protein
MKDANVLGSLPRTRPHRRSDRRPARGGSSGKDASATTATKEPTPPSAGATEAAARAINSAARGSKAAPRPKAKRLAQPAQPAGTPRVPGSRRPAPPSGSNVLGTAVQAAAELAEIGLSLSTRAVRNALARMPRP